MVLCIKDLTIRQGARTVIEALNWDIKKGEHWVLFGLNGSGKTTLLSYLSGFLPAEEGKITLFGQEVTEENRRELRKRVGWVSGSFFGKYYSNETVLEVVLSGKGAMLGLEGWITDREVQEAKALLKRFGLKRRERYPIGLLSKGEQEKVYIARALMGKAELLILDEPCSGMDLYAREAFLHLVETFAEKKEKTILYVTHHTEEILPCFKKAALLKDGSFFAAGDLTDVFDPNVLDPFFGVPTEVLRTGRNFFIHLKFPWKDEITAKGAEGREEKSL